MRVFIIKTNKYFWITVVVLLIGWEIASRIVGLEIILPSLLSIGKTFVHIILSAHSWRIIAATLGRIGITFAIDFAFALLLGIPSGLNPVMEKLLQPIESIARSVPTMGVILLAIIWLGTEMTPLFVTSLIVFPILYRNTVDGIKNLDPGLKEFHKVQKVPFWKTTRYFYIPSLVPYLRVGVIAGLGLAFKVMIASEVLSQPDKAIGTAFQIERARLNTAAVIAWSILVILLSTLGEQIIKRATSRSWMNNDAA